MSAGTVKAGGVFVEIGADPRKFFSALNKVNKSIGNMGRSLSAGGGKLAAAGIGMAAPIAAAVRQGAAFESTLLNIRASTGATAAQIDQIKASSMAMSQALGVGPTEAAQGMLELLKAGMSLDSVLGGAGKTALEFAKVGEMDVAQAAVVMSDAMNVFKVSSDVAANALSSAADASSTSIAEMSEAFSMSSAVAGLAGQSIEDLSATLAILANAGVKGSDAGTSVKTMLMRLMAPADDAVGALDQLGLSVASFRGADGQMKPMVEIIGTLTQAMGGLDQTAKDDIFRRIFGADAIRAASILASEGVDGFTAMRVAMASALPVSEKYKLVMSGLSGSFASVLAAMQRMAIAISDAVAPALAAVVPFITGFIDGLTKLATDNKEAVAAFAKFAVAAIAVGSALVGLGISFQVASFGFAGIGKAANLALMPLSAAAKSAMFVGNSFKHVTGQLGGFAAKGVGSVLLFATQSGVALAKASAGFGTLAVDAVTASTKLAASMTGTALAGISTFARSALATIAGYSAKSTALIAVSAANAGSMATAQVAATVSVVSATVARAAEGNMRAAAIGVQALARLGVAGTTNALIAGAQVARLTSTGSTQLLRLGVTGSTALATIGSTAISVGASTSGAMIKAGTTSGGSLARLATTGTTGLMRIGSAAVATSAVTIGSLIRAAAVGIAQAGAMSLAWLGSLARITAASAISGVAMAVAFLAPFAAIGAAVVAAGALFYAFKDQIFSAMAPVSDLVNQAAGSIASGFSTAVSDGIVVFGDLATTATTTFNGIYAAVAEGDLAGAMDILWLGLQAGWLRGVEALMSYVDPWVAAFQDVFTDIGVGIVIAWDKIYTDSAALLNTMGAFIMGFFDNIANGVMATFDNLVAGIQIAWTRVKGFITGAKDTKERVQKIKDENAARAEQRRQERPGIEGRTARADKENRQAEKDRQDRAKAVADDGQAVKDGRQATNAQRAAERRAGVEAAEGKLNDTVRGKTETRAKNLQVDDLLASIRGATSVDQLAGVGGLGDQFSTLRDLGRLTGEQESAISDALDKAADDVTGTRDSKSAGGMTDPAEVQDRLAASAKSAEVVGTFSSNLGGMGFGSNLAERTAKAAEETAKNTRKIGEEGAVAA
jgi:TP901 family phage tail tape measure protein